MMNAHASSRRRYSLRWNWYAILGQYLEEHTLVQGVAPSPFIVFATMIGDVVQSH
jgi:hypothetical protein